MFDMCLLLPVSYEVLENFQPSFGIDLVGEDFAMYIGEICTIATLWRSHLTNPELDQELQDNTTIREAVQKSLNSLHDIVQLLSSPIFTGNSLDTVWDIYRSGTGSLQKIRHICNFSNYRAFLEIESCDNHVVSDRVAILILTYRHISTNHIVMTSGFGYRAVYCTWTPNV
jgi:hypothetical protein